jgi:hypothetical protein
MPLKKNGGSTSSPAQRACTLSRVSAIVSVSAAQPVAATTRSGGNAPGEQRSEPVRRALSPKTIGLRRSFRTGDAIDALARAGLGVAHETAVIDAAVAADRRQHRAPEALTA